MKMMEAFFRTVVRFRWLVITLVLMSTILIALPIQTLRLEGDVDAVFPDDDPIINYNEVVEERLDALINNAELLDRYTPRLLLFLTSPLMRLVNSSAEGALPTLLATTGPAVNGGDYFGPTKMMELRSSAHTVDTSAASKDETDAKRLWGLSTELTGVEYAL